MPPVPPLLGFSAQTLIDHVGAYAGLASVVGLAVLSLLYFSQAKEVKRLRDWAGRSPERAQELEERVIAQADAARRPPAPAPAPAAAAPAPSPVTSAPAPVAPPVPAGVGAPALASATRFASPSPAPGPVSDATIVESRTTAPPPAAVPAPATAAGAAPPRPPATPANGRTQPPVNRPRPIPPRSGAVAASTRFSGPPPRRDTRTRVMAVAGALLLLAAAVIGAIELAGGGSDKPTTAKKASSATATRPRARGAAFQRGSVVVTVLNGTPQAGVARQVANRLGRDGFKQGTVTNASDQQRSATVISYFTGHRRDALAVSRALGVANVQPIDPETKAIACPQPATCANPVVVTVGADGARTR